eukprot:TRINITY_DN1202_c1_g2_i1.p1 TRINITY_DN1202_c1_g2~~TRINITY_DN1202_c1_g2_i1.p1  ORF type:complete len:650 (+),score=160.28 TRINITY_DN1202_c1_g2_i1:156-2105(+)
MLAVGARSPRKKQNPFGRLTAAAGRRPSQDAPLEPLLLPERVGTAEQRERFASECSRLQARTTLFLEQDTSVLLDLPAIAARQRAVPHACDRLYASRRQNALEEGLPSIDVLAPSSLPSLGDSTGEASGADGSAAQLLQKPADALRRSKFHSVRSDVTGTEEEAGAPWHVVLPAELFAEENGAKLTVKEVVELLVAILESDPSETMKIVASVKSAGKSASVATYSSKAQCVTKVRHLRDRGLKARASQKPCQDASPLARAERVLNVANVFEGKQRRDMQRLAAGMRSMSQRSWEHGSRDEMQQDFDVAPADAVEAYYEYRKKLKAAAEEAAKKKARGFGSLRSLQAAVVENWAGIAEMSGHLNDKPKEDNAAWELVSGIVMNSVGQSLSPGAKAACRLTRIFLFGKVGNEHMKRDKKQNVFYETIGSYDMVKTLYEVWKKMDMDRSGKVDPHEFRAFAQVRMTERFNELDRPPPDVESFVSKLCGKAQGLLLNNKGFFTIEDLLRLVWPCSGINELKVMKGWCRELCRADAIQKVPAPAILATEEREALTSLFEYFDLDSSGSISLDELKNAGLLSEDQYEEYLRDWDQNGDNQFSLAEFCEMMCPAGFRAFETSKVGSLSNGRKVLFDEEIKSWRVETSEAEFDGGWL